MYYTFEKRDAPFVADHNLTSLTDIPHIHPEIELIYLTKGNGVCITDGKEEFLDTGDLYICFPNQIHYYSSDDNLKGFLIIVSPDIFRELKSVFSKKIPQSNIIKKQDLSNDITQRLFKICNGLSENNKLSTAAASGYMQSVLAEALQKMELSNSPIHNDVVKNILTYCLENYTEPITLDSVARALYLSRYYISHIFTDRLKISFPEFINGLRIEHACRSLTAGCNITEVAYSSGFGSVRSFNHNFEYQTGMTPTKYIKAKQNT